MSLILEALRKLERDKDSPERGFVVMTHVPWAQGGKRPRLVGIGALVLALAVGALAAMLWRGSAARPAPPEAKVAAPARPSAPREVVGTASSPAPFEAKALALESLRSAAPPTAAPGAEASGPSATPAAPDAPPGPASKTPRPSALPELKLNAISRQNDKPVAILNDRLVREGDVFNGVRVIRIGETEVEVEVQGQRRVLTF